jgi:xanthine/CO dehydrogenase XdhC/CoxF family maturation factor
LQSGCARESIHKTIAPGIEVLVHYVPPMTRLVIFGAGDDAKPLCDIGASLGWHVSVVDRRARFATSARFPNARSVLAGDWDETVDATTFSPLTAAVLMTHSLDDDARVLSLLSSKPLAYLGVLGPAHRRAWLLAAEPDVRLAAMLHGPIGLDLGDRSAAGIAVAVAAEILAHLNHRSAQSLDAEVS